MMTEGLADWSLMKLQFQQFSMELLHQGEISFTACGFMAIDGTLLKSIISTTITYMIILLQYLQTGKLTMNEKEVGHTS
uniref:Gustatory receptor n=1 Tax=Meteorus pulchricornis TaxID=51522 RepID=A0A346TLM0_9HYME|nr:gustatory receptor [Meteorus pulchricornis]